MICTAPNQARIEDRPEPAAGVGDVLLRMRRVGIRGTDSHIFDGSQPFFPYPRPIGRELAGEVVTTPASAGLTVGFWLDLVPGDLIRPDAVSEATFAEDRTS